MQYNHIRSPLIGGSKRSRVTPAGFRLFISQRNPKKTRRNDDILDPRPPPKRQQKIDKSEWLWECVRPYDPSTEIIKDRLNSCEKSEKGTFKTRQRCVENCNTTEQKKKSEDAMERVRKAAKKIARRGGSKRARGMAGMR